MPSEIIAALIAFSSTVLALYMKDFFDSKRAAKMEEKEQLETTKIYADPLLLSMISLVKRLQEIFQDNARFLSRKAPKNEYYQYMFLSTMYRLCAVLGWLQAANREISGIEIQDQEEYSRIKEAITNFEGALARSNHLAETRLAFLARHWSIPIEMLSREEAEQLGESIDQLIWNALLEEDANFAYELEEDKQMKLLEKVAYEIIEACKLKSHDMKKTLEEKRKSSIRAISRVESWIYKDWQAAIGDMMLMESRGTNRRFEVIGFNRFEDFYLKHITKEEEDNRWLERVVRLFKDLNLTRSDIFDARVQQLRNVCSTGIALVNVLSEVDFGVRKTGDAWHQVIKDDQENNPAYYRQFTSQEENQEEAK